MKKLITYTILTCLTTLSFGNGFPLSDSIPYLGTRYYLSLNLGGGMHTHLIESDAGQAKEGYGGLLELKYQIIPKHWGFGIGMQLCSYRSSILINYGYAQTFTHNDNNLEYQLNTEFSDWEERQDILAIEIPLSLQYENALNSKWKFLMDLGVTLSIPVINEYSTQNGYYSTSGWFESTNVEYEDLQNHGFHTDQYGQSGEICGIAKSLGAFADVGFNRSMGQKCALYMGLYAQYGITNSANPLHKNIYDGEEYIGAFGSEQFTDIHLLKGGMKIGFRFDLRDKKREKEAEQIMEKRREERERQKEIAATAEKLKRERILQEQRERLRKKEEVDEQMEKDREKIEAFHKAALKEKKEAIFALKRIADEAIYAYPNSIPTFPEEIERSFDIVYTYLAKNADVSILIVGHTDNTIKEDKSFTIGQKRAEAFKQALIRKGIPEDRMECVSKGNTQPVASNNTKGGRELNNRTELKLKGSEAEE